MRKFDIGDTVQLKSGGPEMTVKGYKQLFSLKESGKVSETDVVCTWMDKEKKQQGTFHQDMLDFA